MSGFSLLELIVVVSLIAAATPVLMQLVSSRRSDVREQAVAQEMKRFAGGASAYLKENFTSLYAAAGTSGTVAVSAANLVVAGSLPSTFQAVNGFGQTHCLLVRRSPSATGTKKLIEAFAVTEGGRDIKPNRVPFVAAMIGAEGGAVETVSGVSTIRGAYGGYQLLAAPYQSASCTGTAISPGRIVAALFLDNQNLIADYLYRYEVPGRPEANTMSTNINMGGNNLNNANIVQAITLVDRANPAYSVTPSGNTTLNNVNANTILAPTYCDRDDPTFCVDPSGVSRLNDMYLTSRSTTVRVSSLLPNFVDKGSTIVFNNQFLVKPICPDAGTPEIRLAPAVFQPDGSNLSSIFAINTGATWQVRLTTSSGGSMPAGTQALASFGCRYS